MKVLIISISVCLIFCGCKHEDYVPDCVCANLEVINEFPKVEQAGIIIFPKLGFKAIYSLKTDKSVDTWGQGLYGICTDSAFLRQIQDKQIKDSSIVVLKGIGLGTFGWCNVNSQRTVVTNTTYNPGVDYAPILRVKTIDKK